MKVSPFQSGRLLKLHLLLTIPSPESRWGSDFTFFPPRRRSAADSCNAGTSTPCQSDQSPTQNTLLRCSPRGRDAHQCPSPPSSKPRNELHHLGKLVREAFLYRDRSLLGQGSTHHGSPPAADRALDARAGATSPTAAAEPHGRLRTPLRRPTFGTWGGAQWEAFSARFYCVNDK